mgnify:CR=1 FL=1
MVNKYQNGAAANAFTYEKSVKPTPEKQHEWEVYSKQLYVEYRQCIEEGLDLDLKFEMKNAVIEMILNDFGRVSNDFSRTKK